MLHICVSPFFILFHYLLDLLLTFGCCQVNFITMSLDMVMSTFHRELVKVKWY